MAAPYSLFANGEYTDYRIDRQHIYHVILISRIAKVGVGDTLIDEAAPCPLMNAVRSVAR
jgi:hypothetical protein